MPTEQELYVKLQGAVDQVFDNPPEVPWTVPTIVSLLQFTASEIDVVGEDKRSLDTSLNMVAVLIAHLMYWFYAQESEDREILRLVK